MALMFIMCHVKSNVKKLIQSAWTFSSCPSSSFACHAHETWDSWKHQLLPFFDFLITGRKCVWSIVVKCCAILIRGTHGVAVRENDSDVAQKCTKYASTYHVCTLIVYNVFIHIGFWFFNNPLTNLSQAFWDIQVEHVFTVYNRLEVHFSGKTAWWLMGKPFISVSSSVSRQWCCAPVFDTNWSNVSW